MMNSYQFKFKGKLYECCGEDKDLQIRNFNHCIETRDWLTLKNRIQNQLKWFPKDLVEIKERGITIIRVEEKTDNNKDKFW